MVLLILCLYWILLLAYIFNIYQHQIQQQIDAFSLLKGSGNREDMEIIRDKDHSYSREQLFNLRPSFNMRMLNTEQVTRIQEYGLKNSDGQEAML